MHWEKWHFQNWSNRYFYFFIKTHLPTHAFNFEISEVILNKFTLLFVKCTKFLHFGWIYSYYLICYEFEQNANFNNNLLYEMWRTSFLIIITEEYLKVLTIDSKNIEFVLQLFKPKNEWIHEGKTSKVKFGRFHWHLEGNFNNFVVSKYFIHSFILCILYFYKLSWN